MSGGPTNEQLRAIGLAHDAALKAAEDEGIKRAHEEAAVRYGAIDRARADAKVEQGKPPAETK